MPGSRSISPSNLTSWGAENISWSHVIPSLVESLFQGMEVPEAIMVTTRSPPK